MFLNRVRSASHLLLYVCGLLVTGLLSACDDPYGPLCVAFCTDSTRIQREYVDNRDECRQLSELKLDTMPTPGSNGVEPSPNDKSSKSRLVGMFSECMGNKDWSVPGPAKEGEKKETPAAAATLAKTEMPQPTPPKVLDAERRRAADCAFARQAADASIIAKKRAEACQLECDQQRKMAPDAPKPAACGS